MSLLNFRMKLLRQKRVQRHFKLSIFDNFVAQLLIHYMTVPKDRGSVNRIHPPKQRSSQTVAARARLREIVMKG